MLSGVVNAFDLLANRRAHNDAMRRHRPCETPRAGKAGDRWSAGRMPNSKPILEKGQAVDAAWWATKKVVALIVTACAVIPSGHCPLPQAETTVANAPPAREPQTVRTARTNLSPCPDRRRRRTGAPQRARPRPPARSRRSPSGRSLRAGCRNPYPASPFPGSLPEVTHVHAPRVPALPCGPLPRRRVPTSPSNADPLDPDQGGASIGHAPEGWRVSLSHTLRDTFTRSVLRRRTTSHTRRGREPMGDALAQTPVLQARFRSHDRPHSVHGASPPRSA